MDDYKKFDTRHGLLHLAQAILSTTRLEFSAEIGSLVPKYTVDDVIAAAEKMEKFVARA